METKVIACVLIGFFLGPVASLAITPLFSILRKVFFVPIIRKSLREKAERKGHVIAASLQKSHNIRNHDKDFGGLPTMKEMGIYSYQVNGKSYSYRFITSNRLPEELTLYYIKKPRKATVANDLGNWETPWIKNYLIIASLVAIVTVVVGMMKG